MRHPLLPQIRPLPKVEALAVLLSADGLRAYLFCPPGGTPPRVTSRSIGEGLGAAGIVAPYNTAAIDGAADALARGNRPPPGVVAQGTAPQAGERGGWVAPASLADPAIDRLPHFVAPGTILWERHPADAGRVGADVMGGLLPPPPSDSPPTGRGIARAADCLTAADEGYLVWVDDRWEIAAEGAIDGALLSFYAALALSRGITVEGDVPAYVTLEAGGDITVKGNVRKGASLRAAGALRVTGAAEGCALAARRDIVCESASKSTLDAGGSIEILTRLDDGSRASARGSIVGRDASVVANSAVEALHGIDLWVCGERNQGKCVLCVGLTQDIDREIAQAEEEIRRLALQRERVFERFSLANDRVLRSPEHIGRLSAEERRRFEAERADTLARQTEFEAQISALRSKINRLSLERSCEPEATIRIRHQALPPVECWVRHRCMTRTSPLQGPFVVYEAIDHKLRVRFEGETAAHYAY